MTKTKKILLSAIIIGIITILALTTALAIISPLKKDNSKQNNLDVSAAVYSFDSSSFNVDNFTYSADEFTIGTAQGFKNFWLALSEHYTDGHSIFKYSFSGKNVYLTNDIDLQGISFPMIDGADDTGERIGDSNGGLYVYRRSFKGNFDGKGFTISNYYSGHNRSISIFGDVDGSIKNTRFYNCGVYLAGGLNGNYYYTPMGLIAHRNFGTIESCIVYSPYFKSGRFKSDCQVAPFAGDNAGTVKNCIVTGTYKIGGEDENAIVNDEGLYASYFVCATNEAINCVFAATVKKDWVTTETVAPADNDKNAFEDQFSNFSSFKSAHNAWKNGVYTQCSNIPGTIEDYPNYPWFQYGNGSGVYAGTITIPLTNEQIPTYKYLRLRAFIDFTTYTIQAGEGGNVKNTLTGSVGKNTILCVPTQFEGISYTSSDGVGYASPTNYKATSDGDAIFTVETVADQYYIFDGWNDTTATFKRNKTIIQFASVTVGGTTISGSEEIVVDYLDGEPLGDPNYDKTNHTLTYTYSVDGTPTTFVYNFADENAWTVDVTNGSAYSWDATGSAKLTITPTFKLKEYGSVWQ